jgi:hypothetical protein
MIIVKLMGGMGNQMFQYAFGRALSLKYNTPLKIDLSFLKNRNMGPGFIYRDYDLNLFNVYEDFNVNYNGVAVASEPFFHYSNELVNAIAQVKDRNILIDGYWQSPKYFLGLDSQIRKDFEFKNKVDDSKDDNILNMVNLITNSNSVMINVRRTDYLNTNHHGVMGLEYINNSVNIIKSKVENPKFFIFSDDIDWCKSNIVLDNMVIVDHSYKGDRFSYYLQLMMMCKNFIIPNSTFAWWAAWLNQYEDKIVIAPKKWLASDKINTNDIIPSDWIRI